LLKEQNSQPRIIYPVIVSFMIEGVIKTFSDEGKQREFISRSTMKE
jgi:hypothetical protein